jgi:hypothetical protein
VYAGDALCAHIRETEKPAASGDPRFGYIECEVSVTNQHGKRVIDLSTSLLIGRGEGAANG